VPDEVCKGRDLGSIQAELEMVGRQYGSNTADENDVAKRDLANKIVLGLKYLRRCIADEAQRTPVLDKLRALIGADRLDALWAESAAAFSGHVGYYPGYAGDLQRRLTELGVSDTSSHRTFETSASGSTHRARAKAAATGEVSEVSRADILYFRGHQFAQYRAPGMFTDGAEERGVDLRYLQRAGGFPNVKLMISTSCATLCNEALDVFTGLFPNATILGYGKSAPLDGGAVRTEFASQIKKMNLPLILSESSDVARVVGAWKATVEGRHKGEAAKYPRPGYYQGGNVHYWDGTSWTTQARGDADNRCYRKGDFRGQYPEPPPPAP
jgi:hypothetical protein